MSTTQDYDNIMSGMLPSVKGQQQGMYDYLAQLARRQGVAGAMQQAAAGVAPYASEVGQAVGQTSMDLAKLAEQERQFNEQQAAWEKEFAAGQEQWQAEYDLAKQAQDWNQMMEQYQTLGWTPEMLEALGYDLGPTGSFNRPNPALDRMYSSMGIPSYGSSYVIPGMSTPADPFNRVTGAGQGPGLMAIG